MPFPVSRKTDPIGPIRQPVASTTRSSAKFGQGAFATVYLARDLRHDRYVVFKILNADQNPDAKRPLVDWWP